MITTSFCTRGGGSTRGKRGSPKKPLFEKEKIEGRKTNQWGCILLKLVAKVNFQNGR